jgi:hypothetical protein
MRLLVLASEPISATQLREAVGANVDPADAEVMLVAPALQESPLKFWFSDADNAIARAEQVREQSLERLDQEGVAASGDTGESDPMQAIQDALLTFPADRIVLFTHDSDEAQYREDVDPGAVGERFGLPVDHATV